MFEVAIAAASNQIYFTRRDGQLRTSLYDKHDDFNFFCSRVAISNRRPPSDDYLYHSSYDTSGLAPLMNVYSEGYATFYLASRVGICQ